MKDIYITIVLILFVGGLKGQISIGEAEQWNGDLLRSLPAKVLSTGKYIAGFEVDTMNNILYLKLQDEKKGKLESSGELLAYDMDNDQILWQKLFDHKKNYFLLAGEIPLLVDENKTYRIDSKTGEQVWESDVAIALSLAGKDLGLGENSKYMNYLTAVDLKSGKTKWQNIDQPVPGLASAMLSADSALAISSGGIHYIDLENGQGFSDKAKTEYVDYSYSNLGGVVGGIAGAALFSILSHAAHAPTIKKAGNLNSNIAIDNGLIYFASLKDITAYNELGEIVWTHSLARSLKGLCKVFVTDDAVFMLNYGRERLNDTYIFGDVHFSKWHKKTGEKLAENILGQVKREYVNDFLLRDTSIVIALSNRMAEYSLHDLKLMQEKSFGSANVSSGLRNIVNPPAYVRTDSIIENRSQLYPDRIYIENSSGMKIEFSEELEIMSIVRADNFFTIKQTSGSHHLLDNGKYLILTDKEGRIVSQIPFSRNSRFLNDKLIDQEGRQILIMELEK